MAEVLSRYWWNFVVRGILAILFGIVAYVWPGITLATLVILFSAYVLIDGILLIVKAMADWIPGEDRWLLLLEGGLLGIGIGIITLVIPGITAIGLVLYIAAWSLATGVLMIAAAVRLRREIKGECWMIVSSIASILFAIILMIFPGAGALGLLWLIAAYAVIFGVVLLILGFRLRGHRSRPQVEQSQKN